jgi:hypothetical protein
MLNIYSFKYLCAKSFQIFTKKIFSNPQKLFLLAFKLATNVHASIARTSHGGLADAIKAVDVRFIA